MAALNEALREAISGLDPQDQQEVKLVFARVMGEITDKLINPAVHAFPELSPDERTWLAVVQARAAARSNAALGSMRG